jgi:hypothetical protein
MRGSHNFHARDSAGQNFRTKKALAEAIKAGEDVTFTDTSLTDNAGTVKQSMLHLTDVVVGPDPYKERRWYANIRYGKVI